MPQQEVRRVRILLLTRPGRERKQELFKEPFPLALDPIVVTAHELCISRVVGRHYGHRRHMFIATGAPEVTEQKRTRTQTQESVCLG